MMHPQATRRALVLAAGTAAGLAPTIPREALEEGIAVLSEATDEAVAAMN